MPAASQKSHDDWRIPDALWERIEPLLPPRKARRWVVERTHSWMNRFRRVLIWWDKKVRNYLGFLHLACAYITYKRSGLLG